MKLSPGDAAFLLLLPAFIENQRQVVKGSALTPREVLARLNRFAQVRPKQTINYQQFLALHTRSSK